MSPEKIGRQLADLFLGAVSGGLVALVGAPFWAAFMTFAIVTMCASHSDPYP